MEIFKDFRIPMPDTFESPSLTHVGKFQRGILTAALCILPTLQAIQWQRKRNHMGSEFRCGVRDEAVDTSERRDFFASQCFEDYTKKYTGISQGMFILFVLLNLLIVHFYMSYVSERFNSWFKLRATTQRGKVLADLKGSTAVFRVHSIQLGMKLMSAVMFVLYNCLAHTVVLPSEREYQKQWTPPPFVFMFSDSSFSTSVLCYADQAFESSMFNIELDLIDDLISLQELLNLSAFSSRLGDIVYQQLVANPEEVLLIFDGLNEWTTKSPTEHSCTEKSDEKMPVTSLVLNLLSGDLLQGSTIIVTSRPTPLLSEMGEIITFDRYAELSCFKPEELKICIQEFFQDNNELSITVKNRISSDENLEVLCRLPQNCLLLCSYLDVVASRTTFERIQTLELPSTTTGLIERLIETATTAESDQNNHKTFPSDHFDFSKNSQEVLEKLSYLAFEGMINERYVFRKEDLSHVELSAFEVEILEEAGFLRRLRCSLPPKPDIYCFSCLSIQEYLAASRIVQSTTTGDFRDFLEKANENHCATLQFVAGLCRDGKKGKGIFVCLMQHLTEAIKLNSFVDEPVIDNQAISFLCKCLFENGTNLGYPFAREATSSISSKPIVFTEIGTNPPVTQAILHCLKEAIGNNVKRVIFESNAMEDDGFRQVAASICEESCKLDQVKLTSSSITDGAMLSFLEISASHSFLGIKILGLRGNDISSEGAKYLACLLFNDWCHLEELHLGNNRIGDLGVEYFSEALCSGSSRIHTLDLSSNGITHNGVFHLSRALSSPVCNVKRLYLQKNKILDFGMQDLCESLCTGECNLRVLFASSNEITDDGIMFVQRALAHKSCNLQELYLGYNLVTDKGVKSLLQAMPTHQINLKVLSLTNNPITDVGVKMLANALRNSSCNLHRLCISLGRAQVATTKASKLQVRYVNAF
ncbi:NLR, CARD domain-containing protein 3 [Desmophyllum pertusum]|uniref:NLR, CARD domain-containing protein 3 n=1 Tax=Desmophyllum pertusum TaxID=174260 RepID=A0A9W9Z1T9_9CNID|nr:NLR, CARD domain-containing protein 3 [Desmophyllum pertusum]